MQKHFRDPSITPGQPSQVLLGSPVDTIAFVIGLVRRQWPLMLTVVIMSLTVSWIYITRTPVLYTSSATLVIDDNRIGTLDQGGGLSNTPLDTAAVQTQLEILHSENVAMAVIKQLDLTNDLTFTPQQPGILGLIKSKLFSAVTVAKSVSDNDLLMETVAQFRARTVLNRVGLTYAIDVGFRSTDAHKASTIANAIVDAYINEQLEAKYDAAKRSSLWLQNRIAELRIQATAADQAIADFKQLNNLHSVDLSGRSAGEQELAEVNSQLVLAHTATAEAKTRVDRIHDLLNDPVSDPSIADTLKSELITKMRSDYMSLALQAEIWSRKYGESHPATINLHDQMKELRRNMNDEMGKIAQSYVNDLNIALARENALKQNLAKIMLESDRTSQAAVKLKELVSAAESYRSTYDTFLKRNMTATQQESFPITEARLINPATRVGPSSPNPSLITALALGFGAAAALAVAYIRESIDQVFRTSRQVEGKLGLKCITILPKIGTLTSTEDVAQDTNRLKESPRNVNTLGNLGYTLDYPYSRFSEGLRSIKFSVDQTRGSEACMIVGVTSTLPNEGKSMVVTNLAQMLAHAGNRVLLIDADLRNPSLSRSLAPGHSGGLIDVIAGTMLVDEAIWTIPRSGLLFLPVGGDGNIRHTNEILGSNRTVALLASLRRNFDYVLVDLAPLVPIVDTRTTVGLFDSYVFVIEWGKTTVDTVEHWLNDANEIYQQIAGIVLNKADTVVLSRYEAYRGSADIQKYYSRYTKN